VVLRGAPADSLIELTVTDPAGRLVYRSPVGFPATYSAEEVLDPRFGALHVSAALIPMLAERLLIGGLPRSGCRCCSRCSVHHRGARDRRAGADSPAAGARAVCARDFVSGVSHELRTPLAQIRLLAELLHMGRPESEDGRRARPVSSIRRRGGLSYLVENILTFSRSERGGTRLVRAPIDLATAAAETSRCSPHSRWRPAARWSSSRGGCTGWWTMPRCGRCCSTCSTTRTATGRAGSGSWSAWRGAGEVARVWVDDEGRGVPGGERQRVWEPYYRMDRDAAVTAGGSGIGLAVVRDLVQRHGGRRVDRGRRAGPRRARDRRAARRAFRGRSPLRPGSCPMPVGRGGVPRASSHGR
jgi:hypothetical protein